MEGMVSWINRDNLGHVERGKMQMSDVHQVMRHFETVAKHVLELTGADHVLYAVLICDPNGILETIQFSMEPMDDVAFTRITKGVRNALIYALHKRSIP